MSVLSVSMPKESIDKLTEVSKALGIKRSELIRIIWEEWLTKHSEKSDIIKLTREI